MFLTSDSSTFYYQRGTLEFRCVIFAFVLKLHVFDNNFWEVSAGDLAVAFLVHVFCEWGVAWIKRGLPAPTLRILLSFLMNWETISRRFYQFWYQSNSVEFLGLWGMLLCIAFFPEGLLAVVAVLLEVHWDKKWFGFKIYNLNEWIIKIDERKVKYMDKWIKPLVSW